MNFSVPQPFPRADIRLTCYLAVVLAAVVGFEGTASYAQSPVPGDPSAAPATPTPAPYSEQTIADLTRLQQAALHGDYAYRQVAHLADNIGPRLTGSPQAQKAVEYVAAELRALGLEVTLEPVMVPHWVRGEETATLTEFPGQADGTTQKIVLTALGPSVATPPAGLTAEVVTVKDFHELAVLGRARVAGKIVLFNHPFDQQMAAVGQGLDAYAQAVVYRRDGPSAAARYGAVGALVRSVGGAAFRLPHAGQTRYAPGTPPVPAAAVAVEDADLLASLTAQGTVRMRLVLTPQLLPDAPSFNVIADLKGSEHPEQVVIVSGHLDSWDLGTGAIDDGAGVAVSMEVAHLVKSLGLHPKRTIRVIAWMSEENGGAGARMYAREHAAEAANHFAAMESDLGADHPSGIAIAAKPEARELLAPVADVLAAGGAGLLRMTEEAGADVGPLANLHVPTFAPIQDSRTYFNYHHTAADTLDKIEPHALAENAAVMAVTAYALANLEVPLPR